MNDNLFKLKKDGKTVGYVHINGYGQLMFRLPNDSDWYCKDKFWEMMIKKYGFGIPPCSYHPFVTKDKNGKDVFAEDKIRALIPDVSSEPLIGRIVPNKDPLSCWMFKYKLWKDSKEYLAPAPDLQDIELLEEKD